MVPLPKRSRGCDEAEPRIGVETSGKCRCPTRPDGKHVAVAEDQDIPPGLCRAQVVGPREPPVEVRRDPAKPRPTGLLHPGGVHHKRFFERGVVKNVDDLHRFGEVRVAVEFQKLMFGEIVSPVDWDDDRDPRGLGDRADATGAERRTLPEFLLMPPDIREERQIDETGAFRDQMLGNVCLDQRADRSEPGFGQMFQRDWWKGLYAVRDGGAKADRGCPRVWPDLGDEAGPYAPVGDFRRGCRKVGPVPAEAAREIVEASLVILEPDKGAWFGGFPARNEARGVGPAGVRDVDIA